MQGVWDSLLAVNTYTVSGAATNAIREGAVSTEPALRATALSVIALAVLAVAVGRARCDAATLAAEAGIADTGPV